jgi:protein-tyrosine phosphatase
MVCRENVCRSPMAAMLLQRLLVGRLGPRLARSIDVRSAGTLTSPSRPMLDLTVEALAAKGIAAHRAPPVQLSPDAIRSANLILTATRRQRGVVVAEVPGATGYTFTLLQFARLVEAGQRSVHAEPLVDLQSLLRSARNGRSASSPGPGDDLLDPAKPTLAAFVATADQIESALVRVLDLIDVPMLLHTVSAGLPPLGTSSSA